MILYACAFTCISGCYLRHLYCRCMHIIHAYAYFWLIKFCLFLQEFPGFMYLRQIWYEDRLTEFVKSKGLVLQREHISRLWLPDPYCYNAKKSDLMLPDTEVHSVVRIDPNGYVLYSRRSVGFNHLVCNDTNRIINRLMGNCWYIEWMRLTLLNCGLERISLQGNAEWSHIITINWLKSHCPASGKNKSSFKPAVSNF